MLELISSHTRASLSDSMTGSKPIEELSLLERDAWDAARVRDGRVFAGQRRTRGVVHTPPLLARALVMAVDRALREGGVLHGLCSPNVTVVDPACGPGAFVAATLSLAQQRRRGPWRVVAVDEDSTAASFVAQRYDAEAAALGTSLEVKVADTLHIAPAELAGDCQLLVVLGNPPWSVARSGPNTLMKGLLNDFRCDESGQRLVERKLGVLSDAYVRFFRWACACVQHAPRGGALGLWTNGSYLDGPVHRGMRHSLLRWFDAIEVVDFGGSALLAKEAGGEHSRDYNVFGVRPSVALTIALRLAPCSAQGNCKTIKYARIAGTQLDKEFALGKLARGQCVGSQVIRPVAPWFAFVPKRTSTNAYARAIGLHEAMPFHREGVQTNRDAAVIAKTVDELRQRLVDFVEGRSRADLRGARQSSAHYDYNQARNAVARALGREADAPESRWWRRIAYRPFDTRVFAPVTPFCHRPRPKLLQAMDASMFALLCVRKDRGSASYRHAAIARHVADSSYLSSRSSCRTRVFPSHTPEGRLNLDLGFQARMSEVAQRHIELVDVIAYVLALLHCAEFTSRHADALRSDYPRVPLGKRAEQLEYFIRHGQALMDGFLAEDSNRWIGSRTVQQPCFLVGHRAMSPNVQSGATKAMLAATHALAQPLPFEAPWRD